MAKVENTRQWPSRQSTCACGQSKGPRSLRCFACNKAHLHDARASRLSALNKARHPRQIFHCEWCHVEFWRNREPKDALRFCSKRCSALRRMAEGKMPIQDPEVQVRLAIANEHRREQYRIAREFRLKEKERQQQQSQQRAQEQHQQWIIETACACGLPHTKSLWTPKHPYMRRWCDACHTQEFYAWLHVCPNCGQEFYGGESVIHCSTRCGKQMAKRRARGSYPFISNLPIEERNRLAALIALVRAVNRRLHTTGNPTEFQTA